MKKKINNKITNIVTLSLVVIVVFLAISANALPWGDIFPNNDNLMFYYDFEESSGDVVNRLNSSINNGTIVNSPTRGVPGIIGNGIRFDGDDGTMDIVNITSLLNPGTTLTHWSIGVWINSTAKSDGDAVGGGSTFGNLLVEDGAGTLVASVTTCGDLSISAADYQPRFWSFVVITGNETGCFLYHNGTLSASNTANGSLEANQAIVIGSGGLSGQWGGTIDEFFFINSSSISAEQVSNLYDSGAGVFYPSSEIQVVLNSPANGLSTIEKSIEFNATLFATNANLSNATLFIWNSTGDIINQTTNTISGETNITIWNVTITSSGSFVWNVLGVGTNSTTDIFEGYATTNSSFSIEEFEVIDENFQRFVYDTDNSTFQVNISVVSTAELFSSLLSYNGTSYLANITNLGAGQYFIERTIDIPVISAEINKSFNWTIVLDTGSGFSIRTTAPNQQTVTPSTITDKPTGTILYTLLDEENLLSTSGEFKGSKRWYLGGGSVIKNTTFNLTQKHDFYFNTTPSNETMFVSSIISIINETSGVDIGNRLFEFNKESIIDTTKTFELLLPNSSRVRDVIIEVKDEGLAPLNNRLVKIDRFYPGLNQYKMIESRITDNFGQFNAQLIENDVIYRFRFYDLDNNLLKTEDRIIISCRNVICVLPFVIEDDTDVFNRFSPIEGFDYTLNFSTSSNTFTYIWNDITGSLSSVRLEVTRFAFNGSVEVCDSTSTSNPGILNCNVGSSRASYTAEVFRTSSGNEIRIDSLSVKVGDISSTFGLEGLIWSFLLLMIMLSVGLYSPPVGVVLYLVGFFFLGISGIVFIHPGILIAEIVLGILFIWAFKGG